MFRVPLFSSVVIFNAPGSSVVLQTWNNNGKNSVFFSEYRYLFGIVLFFKSTVIIVFFLIINHRVSQVLLQGSFRLEIIIFNGKTVFKKTRYMFRVPLFIWHFYLPLFLMVSRTNCHGQKYRSRVIGIPTIFFFGNWKKIGRPRYSHKGSFRLQLEIIIFNRYLLREQFFMW